MGKSIKKMAPAIGALAGNAMFPGIGGAIGGSLVGSLIGDSIKTKEPGTILPDRSQFNLKKEAAAASGEYAKLLQRSAETGAATGARADVLKQMGQAALGRGPSLAEAQMKAAQDRSLAQQLGALQSTRGGTSALGQRALLQNMAGSGRDIAQQAAIARLGERNDFMNQAGAAEAALARDITGKLNVDIMPKQSMQQYEMNRANALNAANQAKLAAENQMTGSLIGGAASVLASGLGEGGAFNKTASAVTPQTSRVPADFNPYAAAHGGLITKDGVQRKYKDGGFIEKLEKGAHELGDKIKEAVGAGKIEQQGNPRYDFTKIIDTQIVPRKRPSMNKKEGGPVSGPGTETSDSIPAMLSDGEFVIKASEVKRPGILEHLHKINSGNLKQSDLDSLAKALQNRKGK